MRSIIGLLALSISTIACGQAFMGIQEPTYKTAPKTRDQAQYSMGLVLPKGWEDKRIEAPKFPVMGDLPEKFTWQGKTTPIKNQGNCGSCWAFSAQATMEDVLSIWGKKTDLSEQWLVSCEKKSYGCRGGWYHSAFQLIKEQSNVLEQDMPYKAANLRCPEIGRAHV
jgi:hypothetical protein